MNPRQANAALQRALEISEQLVAVADGGDVSLAVHLDAERLQLLKSARAAMGAVDELNRSMLGKIAALNDRTLGLLQHRLRAKGREMDMASVGRRAVSAYSGVSMQR